MHLRHGTEGEEEVGRGAAWQGSQWLIVFCYDCW